MLSSQISPRGQFSCPSFTTSTPLLIELFIQTVDTESVVGVYKQTTTVVEDIVVYEYKNCEANLVTLTDRCSFLCVVGQRGTIAKSMYEEHLCFVALTSFERVEEPSSFRLPLPSLCDLPLLFVFFQVNNGVLHFLYYLEDIYIMVLSVLVFM